MVFNSNKIDLLISWLRNFYILRNRFFKFSSKSFWEFLLQHKHLYSIKSSLALVYLRPHSQYFYLISHVLDLSSCSCLQLISPRLSKILHYQETIMCEICFLEFLFPFLSIFLPSFLVGSENVLYFFRYFLLGN